ncbi:MAG: hotdog fold thioesterase, partial [Woeseia sp.]
MDKTGLESFLANPTQYEGTYLEFLGFKLATWKEGFARLEMPVRPDHRNTVGFLHGGVIASLLDIAGAVAGSHGVGRIDHVENRL